MTVRELQLILEGRYPDDNVTLFSLSHRNMQIIGVNEEQSALNGCLTLDVDWSANDKPVETEADRLKRQRQMLDEQIAKLDTGKLVKAGAKARKHRKASTRTPEEQLLAGYIPTGKRGRPRKIIADPERLAEFKEKELQGKG
jgi:hypothetical protein